MYLTLQKTAKDNFTWLFESEKRVAMFELLDIVRVKKEYPELSLTPKHIGTIVDIHNGGKAYTVEFIDENEDTIEKALYTEFAESELEKVTIIHGLDLPNEVAERNSLIMMKQLGITKEDIENCRIYDTKYICDDSNVLEELIAIRNMTDEQFEMHVEKIRQKEKRTEIMYCKAILKLVELYGVDYIKGKIRNSFYATEEKENCTRYYFCFENENSRKDLKPNYKGWTVYATIDVDKKTYETTIVELQLP